MADMLEDSSMDDDNDDCGTTSGDSSSGRNDYLVKIISADRAFRQLHFLYK